MLLRKVLESVVDDLYRRELTKPPGTQPLENKIQQLARSDKLSQTILAHANTVKALGNVAVHGEGATITKEDALSSLDSVMRVLEWYSTLAPPSPLPDVSQTVPLEPGQSNQPDTAQTTKQDTLIADESVRKKAARIAAAVAQAGKKWRKPVSIAVIAGILLAGNS